MPVFDAGISFEKFACCSSITSVMGYDMILLIS
jgi:hypothetical protein